MITVVGSVNMDLFIETPRLPSPGETVLGRRFRKAPGGKGANQACALARMGARATIIAAVGRDPFGTEAMENLSRLGVCTDSVLVRDDIASGVAFILVDDSGQNQIVVASGANATLKPADIAECAQIIRASQAIVAQLEIPIDTVEAALRLAKSAQVITILNPAPSIALPDTLLSLCDWIIPNESEAARLVGQTLNTVEDAARIARALRARSPQSSVLITLGEKGAWLECGTDSMLIPPLDVEAVDTVGAGDTFVGAFAARLIEGASPRQAAEFANVAAALAVTRRGTQDSIPSRQNVESVLRLRAN